MNTIAAVKIGSVVHADGCRHIATARKRGGTIITLGDVDAVEVTGTLVDRDVTVTVPGVPSLRAVAPCAYDAAYPLAWRALGLPE